MYSVLILTKDEEINIAACLASLRSDDVVVLDSHSTDGTVALAVAAGARVASRLFDNYASQRNAGLALGFKYEWVLMLDADERMTTALHEEIITRLRTVDSDVALFRMRRKDYFLGRWLRRSSGYPTWFGRLVRVGHVRIEREVNEEYVPDGKAEQLAEHIDHYPFKKGVAYWIERHNKYSTMEAAALLVETRRPMSWRSLLSRDPTVRRKWLKQLAYRTPARPLLVFIYLYVVRSGALDGFPGLAFCILRTMYEFMIDLKVRERLKVGPFVA